MNLFKVVKIGKVSPQMPHIVMEVEEVVEVAGNRVGLVVSIMGVEVEGGDIVAGVFDKVEVEGNVVEEGDNKREVAATTMMATTTAIVMITRTLQAL